MFNFYRGREREGESREGSEEVTEVLFLRSDLSVLCLFSVWCLSVSSFWFSVRCCLSINRSREISPFTSTHTEPMRAAVFDSTHSMYQCEIQDEVQF